MSAGLHIFTISEEGAIREGATVRAMRIRRQNVTIPAMLIGAFSAERRGCKLGVLRVFLPGRLYRTWCEEGQAEITAGEIGLTNGGNPKIDACFRASSDSHAIVALSLAPGCKKQKGRTGDCTGWICGTSGCCSSGTARALPECCRRCGKTPGTNGGPRRTFEKFPGETIISGASPFQAGETRLIQKHSIVLVPKRQVFRLVHLHGRHHAERYYLWNGTSLVHIQDEEQRMSAAL